MREGGWEEQGNVNNILVGGGRSGAEFRLVRLLKFMKLRDLTTEDCTLFDDAGRGIVRAVLQNKFMKFLPLGVSKVGPDERKKNLLVALEI